MAERETPEQDDLATRNRSAKLFRRFLIALAVVVIGIPLALVAWRVPMLLKQHPEQDLCEFGTGSTELYDRLRREADAYLDKYGLALFGGYSTRYARYFAKDVEGQIREFAMSRETPTERWAAMHALLRAYGMEFDSNWAKRYKIARNPTGFISARATLCCCRS